MPKQIKQIGGSKTLPTKAWIHRYAEFQTIAHRSNAINWLLTIFTVALFCTFGIILLDGFKVMGFSLPQSVLNELGFAADTEAAGLAGIVFKFLFKA